MEGNPARLSATQTTVHMSYTWSLKVCKIMAFIAIIRGLGLLFYILFVV